MSFTGNEDRSAWKRPRPRLSMKERDAIQAAIRSGDDPDAVAARFDVSRATADRIAGLGGRSR